MLFHCCSTLFYFEATMNNTILPPQLVQALTQSLLQQLRPENSSAGNLRTLLENAIVNYNEPPRTPVHIPITSLTTPGGSAVGSITPRAGGSITPRAGGSITPGDEQNDGTPLSRASSTASVSSTSSTSSNASISSTHEWNDDEGDYLIKRRRPSNAQVRADKKIVTTPVLAKIDSAHLALHPSVRNMLFRRKFTRFRGPNGERSLKKNKDIVIPVFKQLVGPVLKRLTLRHLRSEQAVDPAVTYNILWRRFYYAALQVTKKR